MDKPNQKPEEEVIDIEEFARAGKPVPKDKKYRIRIDKDKYVVEKSTLTGAEILGLAGKTADQYNLYQHVHGAQTKPVKPEDPVDLTAPGVERFTTMKRENTEG